MISDARTTLRRSESMSLRMAEVFEIEDETETDGAGSQTDEQLGKTHGYEGAFKVGDVVKVTSSIRMWHVKAYSKEGFLATGFQGRVIGFDLYGRKFSSLCSAITPIRVEFEPGNEGIPAGKQIHDFADVFTSRDIIISNQNS